MARLPVFSRELVSLALLCLALPMQSCGPRGDPADDEPFAQSIAIQELMDSARIPGLQVAMVEEGAVANWAALGLADAEDQSLVTQGTIFEAASLSKPVAAYVAFRLVDRGELHLDTPLWEILENPRLAHDERARSITPRMVLSHTTGLPNWGGSPLELNADPGEAWGYSGEGFVYLQQAMETLTGKTLQELAETEVFGPLEMVQSSFVWRDGYEEMKATGHDELGRPVDGVRRPDGANAAASLHTTARDYARFLAAVLRGEGLSEASWDAMIQTAADADVRGPEETFPYVGWGLGWGTQDSDGGHSIWHWGDNGVFRAFVIGYPEQGDGLVYFANSEAGLSIAEDFLGLFFEDTFWAARWLDYRRWDDRTFRTRVDLRESFLRSYEEGMTVLTRLREEMVEEVEAEVPGLIRFLAGAEESESALRLAQAAMEGGPEDPKMLVLLAEIQTESRSYSEARESYRKALSLGGDSAEIDPRIEWLDEGLAGFQESPATPEELEAMAGQYGPRRVFIENGRLMYSRDGGNPTPLIPLSRTLFALESSATFRLQFEEGPQGVFDKVLGRYSDGRTDESMRTLPDRS